MKIKNLPSYETVEFQESEEELGEIKKTKFYRRSNKKNNKYIKRRRKLIII